MVVHGEGRDTLKHGSALAEAQPCPFTQKARIQMCHPGQAWSQVGDQRTHHFTDGLLTSAGKQLVGACSTCRPRRIPVPPPESLHPNVSPWPGLVPSRPPTHAIFSIVVHCEGETTLKNGSMLAETHPCHSRRPKRIPVPPGKLALQMCHPGPDLGPSLARVTHLNASFLGKGQECVSASTEPFLRASLPSQ